MGSSVAGFTFHWNAPVELPPSSLCFERKSCFCRIFSVCSNFCTAKKQLKCRKSEPWSPPPLIGNKKVLLGCHAAGIAFPIKSAPRAGPILSNGFCHTEGDTREKEERNVREKDERNRGERKKRKTRAKQERMKG